MNADNPKSLSKFDQPQSEPLFVAISPKNAAMQAAYDQASETIEKFIAAIQQGGTARFLAKLRFRDPDESDRLGEDQIFFLWLSSVHYHPKEKMLSGTFFEVPPEIQKWHAVGSQLAFDPEDVFDWMILDEGKLRGGFTIRVTRSHLPEGEREAYDRYLGVSSYEPDPE